MKLNTKLEFFTKPLITLILIIPLFASCSRQRIFISENTSVDFKSLTFNNKIDFSYAEKISIEKTEGYSLVKIQGEKPALVIEDNYPAPKNIPSEYTICRKPLDKTYLVSTSAMDFFIKLDILPSVKFSCIKKENWFLQEAVDAMEKKELVHAGKYSAPDYELLLKEGCNIAIENTMIYHKPEVKEKLAVLGIPVIVEKSSYEKNPLGRLEWIKFYGLLYGKEEKAENFFSSKIKELSSFSSEKKSDRTVAFFYITSSGTANVRKSSDYIPKMISMSGGKYFLDESSDNENNHSTMNMQFENFYAKAVDADILIYNSTIDGILSDRNELLKKNNLFEDFKAYKNERIYCTKENFFQETTGITDFIIDLNKVLKDDERELTYLDKLK
ncbi:ABC transporter substrate-binding protein [Treponema sp.]|uniref:ABC transporter substrate-binding protein n=1 Tax=Treponema sp. TaxID=166 RepID=UPI00298E1E17|nr:ABC transporter substrate-binding protein [Treponema sp.]MCQ2240048.1 ABC transporter substrate-binding protein [Treponema sp.]